MGLSVCLIFMTLVSVLTLVALENNLLNQKMSSAYQAEIIALNSAEAGLIAEEASLNGESVNLNNIKGEVTYRVTADDIDDCQQHIYFILSTAHYQNAHVTLQSAYLKARQPALPNCRLNQNSHRLWWQQADE